MLTLRRKFFAFANLVLTGLVMAGFGVANLTLTVPAVAASGDPGDAYEGGDAIYRALVRQPHETIKVGGGEIDVVFADGAPGLDRAPVRAWIEKSALAVTTYIGEFPAKRVGLLIVADDGRRISSGVTYGTSPPVIRVGVGRQAGETEFTKDWIMVHEFVHLMLPVVPQNSAWLMEGSATYIEPVARAQAGQIPVQQVWSENFDGMPRGLPPAGDPGLDRTGAHDRIYWGGALFFMMADVQIRQQTQNRFGVQDAVRAIHKKSGGNSVEWPVKKVLEVGDAATGTRVLTNLYNELRAAPGNPDLDGLFAKLGISRSASGFQLDDSAPDAAIRKAITAAALVKK